MLKSRNTKEKATTVREPYFLNKNVNNKSTNVPTNRIQVNFSKIFFSRFFFLIFNSSFERMGIRLKVKLKFSKKLLV